MGAEYYAELAAKITLAPGQMPPIQNQPPLGPATQQDQRYQVLDTHPGFSLFLGYGSEWPVQDPTP